MKKFLPTSKRLFALLLALALGMGTAHAYDFYKNCSTGQRLYYNIIDADQHFVEITYPGNDVNYPWAGFTPPSGPITLPSTVTYNNVTYTVTKIGDYAFYSTYLTGSLTIPNSVTSIGDYAFFWCVEFNGQLTLSDAVTSIGLRAFEMCTFTGSLTIPDSVTTIGVMAFELCTGFTGSLTLGNSVTTIGFNAFCNCHGFTGSLTIPASVTSIGGSAFENCTGFTQVNYNAVNCADVTDFQQPFHGCEGTLTIGSTVQRIPAYMFNRCSGFTGTLTIPASVTSIGASAFKNCTGFTQVNYNAVNCADVASDDMPFEGCGGTLTIGSTVQRIPAYMFNGCSGFTGSLSFPDAVTEIGDYAFANCGFTGTLTLGSQLTTIGGHAFHDCRGFDGDLTIPNSVTSIGESAFYFCGFDGSLTLSNSLTTISYGAFNLCSSFTGDLKIPNSVTSIGLTAFGACSGFNGMLTIGSSVSTINSSAFHDCTGFTSMTVLPETPPTIVGIYVFNNVPTNIPVYVPCPSLADYQAATGWSDFTNIQCLSETLTVYDGTATNSYVPVYGYYTDAYLKAEFVMPAAELADMAGGTIKSMKFYATQTNVNWGNASFTVFLTEVADATINAFAGPGIVVYQGALSIVGGEMTVNFTTPYPYNGGNLLVGIYNTVKGSYVSSTWYGKSVTGASVQGYSYSSLSEITPTQRNFIPKTTFSYTPSECSSPKDLTETDITFNSATLNWTGYQDSYDLRYRKKPLYFEDFENGLPTGWTTIDNDGDGYDWHSESNYGSSYCHSGSTIMVSASYVYENNTNIALTPDNWLITPLLDLQGTMKVWIRAWHPNYAQEHFAIYLSTTGNNVSDFTTTLVPETTLTNTAYRAYTADLSAYAGQQGYIAIRHFNCTDKYELLVDDFGLFEDPDETGGWETLSDIESSYTLDVLLPDTEYEWQVRGRDCDGEGTYTGWSRAHSFVTLPFNLCPPEDQCELTFALTDSYGDGWNGAAINVVDVETNTLLASMSAPSHGGGNVSTTDTYTLTVCDGRELRFEWVNGSWDSECSYTVTDINGNEVFSGEGAMSEPVTYMVNCTPIPVFLTDGNWNEGSHWSTGMVPPAGSDVVIQANATVPAGYVAVANEVSLNGGSITVADGGQLKHNTLGLVVTMKKNIEPYTEVNSKANYYLLAFPFYDNSQVPASMSSPVPASIASDEGCDFFRYDPYSFDAEWRNHKQTPVETVYLREGYLYANSEPIELSLTGGTVSAADESMTDRLVMVAPSNFPADDPREGWELLGNPFTYNAYIYRLNGDNELEPMPIMIYDAEGEVQTLYGGPIAPLQGFFVHVTETTTVCFRGTALHYVDLGLPSGLLWATCNVGASSPEDYGDYFAWGETTPKDTYNWSTYQYCMGNATILTKYCNNPNYGYNGFHDHLTILLPEDDAATTNWGGNWRMPTKAEFEELYNNTTVTVTTRNGVSGQLFTASNGNSLFLPAAGYRYGSSFDDVGSDGYYWSSSLHTESPSRAEGFIFYSDDPSYSWCEISDNYRRSGLSLRPVHGPEGPIDGKFTINDEGGKVCFSQGNLQYKASTDTWRFAEHQYDYIGDANSNISSSYNGYIDLFGWGTSNYNHGANCYQPWSTSETCSDYYAYGSADYDLNDQTGKADWGYNAISNGGNTTNQWRTLTMDEWDYVFYIRSTVSNILFAKAKVANVNGVILLPDNWQASYFSLSNTNTEDADFSNNIITANQWQIMEQYGAVFLPAAGFRNGTSVSDVGSSGYYWSASYVSSYHACNVYFNDSYLDTYDDRNRYFGQSVRLVRVVE